jgi:hypothetical protein
MISMTVIETVSEARARRPEDNAGAQQRQQRQRIAEEKGQDDGQHDRGEVSPPAPGPHDHAQHLADGTAGKAMHRRAQGDVVE